ncbi:MAG TPA: hypothetical protein VIN62_03845, partial [Candidatus Cryosericum sp.]
MRAEIGGLSIPYVGLLDETPRDRPDLTDCTRIEVAYEPSLLEYLFPHPDQQSLLNPDERQCLQQERIIIVDSRE